MTKWKSRPPESATFVAATESIGQTYYISEMRGEVRRVDDEASSISSAESDAWIGAGANISAIG